MKPISSIFSCIKFSSPLIMRVVGLHWALFNTSFSPYLNWGNLQLYTLFQVLPMKFQVEWTNHMPLSAGFYLIDAAQVCLPCCPTTLLISVHFPVLSCLHFSRTIPPPVFLLGTIPLCSTFHLPLLNLIKLFLVQDSSPLQCLHAVACLCSVSTSPPSLMLPAGFLRRHTVL